MSFFRLTLSRKLLHFHIARFFHCLHFVLLPLSEWSMLHCCRFEGQSVRPTRPYSGSNSLRGHEPCPVVVPLYFNGLEATSSGGLCCDKWAVGGGTACANVTFEFFL